MVCILLVCPVTSWMRFFLRLILIQTIFTSVSGLVVATPAEGIIPHDRTDRITWLKSELNHFAENWRCTLLTDKGDLSVETSAFIRSNKFVVDSVGRSNHLWQRVSVFRSCGGEQWNGTNWDGIVGDVGGVSTGGRHVKTIGTETESETNFVEILFHRRCNAYTSTGYQGLLSKLMGTKPAEWQCGPPWRDNAVSWHLRKLRQRWLHQTFWLPHHSWHLKSS